MQECWVSSDAERAISTLCLVLRMTERPLDYARIELEKKGRENPEDNEVVVDPVIESFPRAASHGKACRSSSGRFAQASTLRFTWI